MEASDPCLFGKWLGTVDVLGLDGQRQRRRGVCFGVLCTALSLLLLGECPDQENIGPHTKTVAFNTHCDDGYVIVFCKINGVISPT